jgi:uncharacterized protein (DUF433 family)
MPASPVEDERIVRDPRIMVGKPVVRGTRIPVELILEQLAFNLDLDDLFGAYPELTREDVKACLRYAQRAVARARSETSVAGGTTRASA